MLQPVISTYHIHEDLDEAGPAALLSTERYSASDFSSGIGASAAVSAAQVRRQWNIQMHDMRSMLYILLARTLIGSGEHAAALVPPRSMHFS